MFDQGYVCTVNLFPLFVLATDLHFMATFLYSLRILNKNLLQ